MDFLTVIRVLLRRWYVLLPALAVTGVTAYLLAAIDSATYASYGSVILQPGPAVAGDAEPADVADPLLQPDAQVLAEALNDATLDLPSGRAEADFEIVVDPTLPILRANVSGDSPQEVLATAQAIAIQAPVELRLLQLGGELEGERGLNLRQLVTPVEAVPVAGGDGFRASGTWILGQGGPALDPVGDLGFAATVLRERMRSDDVRQELRRAGATEEYTIQPLFDGGRLLAVWVDEGDDPEATVLTSQLVIRKLEELLEASNEREKIPEPFRPTIEVLAFPEEAEIVSSNTMRIVLAVIALGILASVGLSLMVDAFVASGSSAGRGEPESTALDSERRERALANEGGANGGGGSLVPWWTSSGQGRDGP